MCLLAIRIHCRIPATSSSLSVKLRGSPLDSAVSAFQNDVSTSRPQRDFSGIPSRFTSGWSFMLLKPPDTFASSSGTIDWSKIRTSGRFPIRPCAVWYASHSPLNSSKDFGSPREAPYWNANHEWSRLIASITRFSAHAPWLQRMKKSRPRGGGALLFGLAVATKSGSVSMLIRAAVASRERGEVPPQGLRVAGGQSPPDAES